MIGTVVLISSYPEEYQVRLWWGTLNTEEKPSWTFTTKNREKAITVYETSDSLLKQLEEETH